MRHTIVNVEINIIFAKFCETNMTVKKKKKKKKTRKILNPIFKRVCRQLIGHVSIVEKYSVNLSWKHLNLIHFKSL